MKVDVYGHHDLGAISSLKRNRTLLREAKLTQYGTKNVFVSFNNLTIKFCVVRELKQRPTATERELSHSWAVDCWENRLY